MDQKEIATFLAQELFYQQVESWKKKKVLRTFLITMIVFYLIVTNILKLFIVRETLSFITFDHCQVH